MALIKKEKEREHRQEKAQEGHVSHDNDNYKPGPEGGGIKQDNKMFVRLVAPQKKSYTSLTGYIVGVKTINELHCNCSHSFHCLVRFSRVLQFPNQITFTQSSGSTNSDQNYFTTYEA